MVDPASEVEVRDVVTLLPKEGAELADALSTALTTLLRRRFKARHGAALRTRHRRSLARRYRFVGRSTGTRDAEVWSQCRVWQGQLFVLNPTQPASFDSRYFGPITQSMIYGRASPLWTLDELVKRQNGDDGDVVSLRQFCSSACNFWRRDGLDSSSSPRPRSRGRSAKQTRWQDKGIGTPRAD